MHHRDTEWDLHQDSEGTTALVTKHTKDLCLRHIDSFCLVRHGSHRAVVILRAHVAVFLAPVDLEETAAADLTQSLMGGLVHTCSKPDITVIVARR